MKRFSLKEGEFLVKVARKTLEAKFFGKGRPKLEVDEKYKQKRGVFVTLEKYPGKQLRGCIGYPRPVMPLIDAVQDSAINAAKDPRFPPLKKEELNHIIIEITVLTEPELLTGEHKDYPKQIEIGRHGLIVDAGITSGLLLPQVAVEYNWDEKEFLGQTCWKAGLTPDCWLAKETKVYKFEGQIFVEESPGGEVVERFHR